VLLSKMTRRAPTLTLVSRVSWVDRLTLTDFEVVPATPLLPEDTWREATNDRTDLAVKRWERLALKPV
jgi:hypothetical protein